MASTRFVQQFETFLSNLRRKTRTIQHLVNGSIPMSMSTKGFGMVSKSRMNVPHLSHR